MPAPSYERWRYERDNVPGRSMNGPGGKVVRFEDGQYVYEDQGDWFTHDSPPINAILGKVGKDTRPKPIVRFEDGTYGYRDQGDWYGNPPPPLSITLNAWRDKQHADYARKENMMDGFTATDRTLYSMPMEHTNEHISEYYGQHPRVAIDPDVYRQQIFDDYHFTPSAQDYLRDNTTFDISNPYQLRGEGGGGGWYGGPSNRVNVLGPQDEATVHENAHAWWETQRNRFNNPRWGRSDEAKSYVKDLLAFADNPTEGQLYPRAYELANEYKYGNSEGFEGMYETKYNLGHWNDHEMYAGMASGLMGDTGKLPPELRPYFSDLFDTNYVRTRPDTPLVLAPVSSSREQSGGPSPQIEPRIAPETSAMPQWEQEINTFNSPDPHWDRHVVPPVDELEYFRDNRFWGG